MKHYFERHRDDLLGWYLNAWVQSPDGKVAESIATHSASEAFIRTMMEETEKGYGFVPFIGAGFSVSAGVPIIKQFHNYLKRCIAVAVGAETDGTGAPSLWNPRTDNWPPFIDLSRPEQPMTEWSTLVLELVKHRKESIYQEAYGAMAEWRSSLHFLSRVQLDIPRSGKAEPKPVLGVPSQDVIDACLRQVLRANAPGLNHIMLATLSQVLRIDTIVTTNFDDLTEKAFEDSRNHLEVFDVHLGDKLPAFNAVARARSIIKINGSQNSLRADYSLDGDPPYEDRVTFSSYIAGQDLARKVRESEPATTRNHVLLFGVALSESRTKGFLKFAIRHLIDLKVFLVCYRPADVQAVRDFLQEYDEELKSAKQETCGEDGARVQAIRDFLLGYDKSPEDAGQRTGDEQEAKAKAVIDFLHRYDAEPADQPATVTKPAPARCIVLHHTDAGLLLLHLYQFFRKALPPANALFPSITRLSLPRLPPSPSSFCTVEEAVSAIFSGEKRVAIVVPEDISGVREALQKISIDAKEYTRLDITLQDGSNTMKFIELFRKIYAEKTQRDWEADADAITEKNHLRQINEHLRQSDENVEEPKILLIIDATELPLLGSDDSEPPPGKERLNAIDSTSRFRVFLDALTRPREKRTQIQALVVCREEKPAESAKHSKFVIDFKNAVESAIQGDQKLVMATSLPNVRGVSAVAGDLFRKYEPEHLCLWLELHDVHSTDDLFEAFQEAAYRKLGETDWTPLYAVVDNGRHRSGEIDRIADSSAKPLMLFIDARERPGANRDDTSQTELLNGWLDQKTDSPDFITLLRQLTEKRMNPRTGLQRRGITVILLCRGEKEELEKTSPLKTKRQPRGGKDENEPWRLVTMARLLHPHEAYLSGPVDPASDAEIILAVLRWAQAETFDEEVTAEYKKAFLKMLLAIQRPRHLAVCWDQCGKPRTQRETKGDDCVEGWLQSLEKIKLVRRKNGGFIWLNSRLRQILRSCLTLKMDKVNAFLQKKQEREWSQVPNETIKALEKLLQRWIDAEQEPHGSCTKAELHLSIAKWYLKLFDSTGSSRSLLEAIEHLMFTVNRSIRDADSPDLHDAEHHVDSARHLLREHLFSLQTEGHPKASLRRLRYICEYWVKPNVQEESNTLVEAIEAIKAPVNEDARASLLKAIAKFQCSTVEVMRAIYREIGEDRLAFDVHREIGIRSIRDTPESETAIDNELRGVDKFSDILPMWFYSAKGSRKDHWIRWWRWTGMLGIASRSFTEAQRSLDRGLDAALALGRKEPVDAKKRKQISSLRKLLTNEKSLKPKTKILEPEIKLLIEEEFRFFKRNAPAVSTLVKHLSIYEHDKFSSTLEMLHTIELASSCRIVKAHTLLRGASLRLESMSWPKDDPDAKKKTALWMNSRTDAEKLLKEAEKLSRHGLKLVEDVQSSYRLPKDVHDFDLFWCKSRLWMATALATMHEAAKKFNSPHAMSLLGNAAACLRSVTPDRGRADIALIELRRADVRLQEAGEQRLRIPQDADDKKSCSPKDECSYFEQWTYDRLRNNSIWKQYPDPQWKPDPNPEVDDKGNPKPQEPRMLKSHIEELRSLIAALSIEKIDGETEDDKLTKALKVVNATATDAIRFLDRALPTLRERRRNVWWTTWYLERRLRAIALICWVSVVETGQPIPFLGLEAAMRKTDTDADTTMRDAIRMIRVDAYRLAMVLLSYASCARALQMRLHLDEDAVHLQHRLETMKTNLIDGLDALETTIRRRDRKFPDKMNILDKARANAKMDDAVVHVIDEVRSRVTCVITSL